MIGDGTDAVRVGNRTAPELLDEQTHGSQGYRRLGATSDGFRGPVHSSAVPSADKRQRKKENARIAREAREAAEKRRKRLRTARNVGIVAVVFVGGILLVNWLQGGGSKKAADSSTTTTPTTVAYPAGCRSTAPPKAHPKTYKAAPPMTINTAKTYVAHVATNCGTFDITLDANLAPKTANSFVFLANQHFYDGLTWHRLVKEFVVQGGDPKGDGTGGPGYTLPDEPPKTGYKVGSVAMANSGPHTSGSQFFVTVSANGAKQLGGPPYKYSSLGTVTKGMSVVDTMMKLAPATDGAPLRPLYIDKITISES